MKRELRRIVGLIYAEIINNYFLLIHNYDCRVVVVCDFFPTNNQPF